MWVAFPEVLVSKQRRGMSMVWHPVTNYTNEDLCSFSSYCLANSVRVGKWGIVPHKHPSLLASEFEVLEARRARRGWNKGLGHKRTDGWVVLLGKSPERPRGSAPRERKQNKGDPPVPTEHAPLLGESWAVTVLWCGLKLWQLTKTQQWGQIQSRKP